MSREVDLQKEDISELQDFFGGQEPSENLQEIGMKDLTTEEFQQIFDYIEILINVRERIRGDRRREIMKKAS